MFFTRISEFICKFNFCIGDVNWSNCECPFRKTICIKSKIVVALGNNEVYCIFSCSNRRFLCVCAVRIVLNSEFAHTNNIIIKRYSRYLFSSVIYKVSRKYKCKHIHCWYSLTDIHINTCLFAVSIVHAVTLYIVPDGIIACVCGCRDFCRVFTVLRKCVHHCTALCCACCNQLLCLTVVNHSIAHRFSQNG